MSGEHVVHGGIIPEHIRPGARFDVQLPNGRRIPILCPENRRGGDRFLLRPFQVQIPAGIKRGKVFNVEANNRQYRVRCPKGKRSGDMLIIQIPEFPEPGYDSVAQGAASGSSGLTGSKPYEVPHSYFLKVEKFDTDQIEVPNDVVCPITQEIMVDPVVAMDGHSYERKAVEQWLSKHQSSPKTNEKMSSNLVIPNHALRARIMEFIESFGDLSLEGPPTSREDDDDEAGDNSKDGDESSDEPGITRKVTATSVSDINPDDVEIDDQADGDDQDTGDASVQRAD